MADGVNLIVQAGGRGSRLEHYCWNKPKCLVPINGKPMLYQLLDAVEQAHAGQALNVRVIAEHKAEALERYLDVFPPRQPVRLQRPKGHGTTSGIPEALADIGDDEPVWIVWSDLTFHEFPPTPEGDEPVIFLSRSFTCRWSVASLAGGPPTIVEQSGNEAGIMGLFWFPRKSLLRDLPESGEFVRWLSENLTAFRTEYCDEALELGTLNALLHHWDSTAGTRFFNRITYQGDRVVKQAVVKEYEPLIGREIAWYRAVGELGFANVPTLLDTDPMTLTRIDGHHPFQLPWGTKGRRQILENILDALDTLHSLGTAPAVAEDVRSVYLDKTVARIAKVRRLLPQLGEWRAIKVNGVWVPNVLHDQESHLLDSAFRLVRCKAFTVIHGDPTFSNILVDANSRPWFIDPRGYFAAPGIYGDPNYDWAKLYYSVIGSYDSFNRRHFILTMDDQSADVEIRDSGWAHLGEVLRERLGTQYTAVRILHAFIWLALSGWVDDDYDSIVAAYCNGLYHLHQALES
ncbi:NTP transferase domain-containing protein [Nitrospirillum iridis]|uniref:MobA-like NTP transferase domain-containing protein n=1 Tax=Nitrospirillum iridis TaxID=765888 RepID=A0A7X0B218_9PROT|nr:NTP transferase domain-containing protein [Nitrospirillum iridis]MBB6252951.1 hypothetical protein [Nitrospirillum iridis]